MGVTQYIGSRYVPVFADPADWNSTRTYEPLTIVMNEGNSYTSKQYVPKGIDISNEDFWALTGNYNAQVEQYRKDVLAFDGRITANSDAISSETNRATEAEKKNADAISSETNRATEAEKKNAQEVKILKNSLGEIFTTLEANGYTEGDISEILAKIADTNVPIVLLNKTYELLTPCELPNNTEIIGTNSGQYGEESVIKCSGSGCIKQTGTSVTKGGPHKNSLKLKNLRLSCHSDDYALQLICSTYFNAEDVWFTGNKQVLLWETFDSCFMNCSFEYGGNPIGVEIASGNRGDSDLPEYENTNTIDFINCRFESGVGSFIKTTTSKQDSAIANNIHFYGCHIESTENTQALIDLSYTSGCTLTDCSIVSNSNAKNETLIAKSVIGFSIDKCFFYRSNFSQPNNFGQKALLNVYGNEAIYILITRVYDPNNTLPKNLSRINTAGNISNGIIFTANYNNIEKIYDYSKIKQKGLDLPYTIPEDCKLIIRSKTDEKTTMIINNVECQTMSFTSQMYTSYQFELKQGDVISLTSELSVVGYYFIPKVLKYLNE